MSYDERAVTLRLPDRRSLSRSFESFFEASLRYERQPGSESPIINRREWPAAPSINFCEPTATSEAYAPSLTEAPSELDGTVHDFFDAVEYKRNYSVILIDFTLLDEKMPDSATMALKETRSLTPRFDGTKPEKVDDIIKAYEYVDSCVAATDRESLLQAVLKTNIVGKAKKDSKHKSITNFQTFKDEFTALYGTRHTIATLQVEFNTCKQKAIESALAYGQRLENVMMELIEASTAREDTDA